MRYMTDEIATILAERQPRRKTFKLLAGVLAGGLFGTLSERRAYAVESNTCGGKELKKGETCCAGVVACAKNKTCCTSGVSSGKGAKSKGSSFCISLTKQCGNSQPEV